MSGTDQTLPDALEPAIPAPVTPVDAAVPDSDSGATRASEEDRERALRAGLTAYELEDDDLALLEGGP